MARTTNIRVLLTKFNSIIDSKSETTIEFGVDIQRVIEKMFSYCSKLKLVSASLLSTSGL